MYRWLITCCCLTCSSFAVAEDFPHWRGAQRNDHVAEDSGFEAKAWPLQKPAWQTNVGEGSTSPIVADGKLYVLGWKSDQDSLQAFDAKTGELLWKQSYEAPRYARHATGDEGLYSGPTGTPEYDAATKLLYTLGSDGELRCWKTDARGEVAWRKNLYDDYHMPQRPRQLRSGKRDYGYTSAPLVYNDWLLVEVGGDRGTVVVFDKRTGAEIWTSEHRGLAGHTGGLVPLKVDGVACIALLTLTELLVLRVDGPSPGKTVATFPWETEWANNLLTPTICDDSLLISAWHTHHAIARIQISLKEGAKKLWQTDRASHTGSPVVDGDRIYFAGDKLVCLDAASGKIVWEGGAFKDGASLLLTKDERLIALGSHGHLVLVETARRSPDTYRELSRVESLFSTDAWPHVVLAHGLLCAKDRAGNLKCFRLPTR
jgi:outer membrane protein assembly factor BamB